MDDLEKQFAFLTELEKLKLVTRVNRALDGRAENSAEHTWHVCLVAMILHQYADSNVDLLTVLKMLLIHDIVEIDAGDIWLFAEDQTDKFEKELAASNRIFGLLPPEQADEYKALWLAFETRASEEAKFAAAIDSLQPLLNHLVTGDPATVTVPLALVKEKKAHIKQSVPALWPAVDRLLAASVENGLYT